MLLTRTDSDDRLASIIVVAPFASRFRITLRAYIETERVQSGKCTAAGARKAGNSGTKRNVPEPELL
jgi:hypothetical protein